MRICDDLRQAVLQAAIQGKLTKQLPEDGDAADLLKQIAKEKSQLIKEGRIKKEKALQEISLDEIPFDIPDSWCWKRLLPLALTIVDCPHSTPRYYDRKTDFAAIDTNCIDAKGKIIGWRYVDEETYQNRIFRLEPVGNDIVYTREGSICRAAILPFGINICLGQRVMLIRCPHGILAKYIKMILMAPQTVELLTVKQKGIGAKHVNVSDVCNLVIPVPPTTEQHRIVALVEELMARIDDLEKTENELEKLKAAFPGDMKAALLQAAMQGKLTEQLPEDGDAADLLEQIVKEKNQLIKEGKIKKEKPVPEISLEGVPFDIPENWKWAYIGDIFEHNSGKALNSNNTKGKKHKYITTSNVYWDHFELSNLKEMYYTDEEVEKYSVKKGDLLVLEGGDVGRTAIWDLDESYCIQNHLHRLRAYVPIVIKYFYFCMMYFKIAGMVNGKGIAIQGLSANALHSIIVPLPPL